MRLQGANAYLSARVSILAGQLLTLEQIQRLPLLGVDAIARRYGLGTLDDEHLPVSARLRTLESGLINTLLSELPILIRPMYGEARELVLHWARKFELFNVKALIRGKLSGLDEAEISANLHQLPAYLALPHQTLLRTESVLELLRQLEKGQYRAIASQAREVYEERHESFALEGAIDQRYYAGLVKHVRQLSQTDLHEAQRVVGLHLDRVNLMWMLRYRFTYQLSPSETYYQLAPSTLHLHRERLLALVNLPSRDRLLEALPSPLRELMEGAASTAEVERRMHAMTSSNLRSVVAHSRSAVARALAYLVLRELDLKRLFAVVQARLLHLDDSLLRIALGLDGTGSVQAAA
jgi:V/A-type H+/Na+-transporting ATPase subunit C